MIKSGDKKTLISNFLSLSTLQALNMLLPLVTLPYLVRVLGVENFGLLSFTLSIITYLNILVSFGFELSATREISINQNDINKISEIFSTVMLIKITIAFFSLLVLSILLFFIDSMQKHMLLYYVTFGIIIGNVVFPSWFFQGMERMKYITYINVISKIAFTILIFILVQDSVDYIYVPLLNSLGAITGGFYSLFIIFKLFKIKIIFPSKKMITTQLLDSYHFFLSRVANDGSRAFATTIIGMYFGNVILGYYSMVEKLFYAFISLGGIVSQTIYPYMSRTKNIDFFRKIFLFVIGVSIIILIPTIYFNELILSVVFNLQNEMLSEIFIIVFSASLFGIASALTGYPLLAAFGYVKYANNSLIYASLMYIIYIFIAVYIFKDIYIVSSSVIFYNIIGLLFRIYYIKKTELIKKGNL